MTAVARSATTHSANRRWTAIQLLAGLNVDNDADLGRTVTHRSRVARDPSQPNLHQVHLIHAELFDELRAAGVDIPRISPNLNQPFAVEVPGLTLV